jgi:hypothetical protein
LATRSDNGFMRTVHLGKTPARPGAVKFSLGDYIPLSALPSAPEVFGHTDLVPVLGMLGNDKWGCCVFSGAAHEHMGWNAAAGKRVAFTEEGVLGDYSAVTGFDPNDPNTDQGTDMEVAAKYRRKVGVVDATGRRHPVGAYVALPGVDARGANDASFLSTLANAVYVFEAVGVGIEFPASAMDQFDAGEPWDVVSGSQIAGGHYIPIVGRVANGNFLAVTWGRVQEVTPGFLQKYVDEAIVYLTTEFLSGAGRTLEGFDLAALNADLVALGGSPIPTPAPSPVPAPTPAVPFPVSQVQPWLDARCFTSKGKAAQSAIRRWLAAGGE